MDTEEMQETQHIAVFDYEKCYFLPDSQDLHNIVYIMFWNNYQKSFFSRKRLAKPDDLHYT